MATGVHQSRIQGVTTWLLAAGLLVGVVVLYRVLDGRKQGGVDDDRLRALAHRVAKDRDTAVWVAATRRAVADGSAGKPWGDAEIRERLAGVSAGIS